ncbi:MAG: efflux RND transporter periplasmic adaptor subunit [Treponematales bacterium]
MDKNSRIDAIVKIAVVALIAVFLGLTAFNMMMGGRKTQSPMPQAGAGGNAPSAQGAPAGPPSGGAAAMSGGGAAAGGSGAARGGGAGTAAASGGRGSGAAGAARSGSGGQAQITVSARSMERGVIRQIVRLNGEVKSQTEVDITPDTGGKITRLLKAEGDTVRRGEVLGYLDPSRPGESYEQSPFVAAVGGTVLSLPVSVGETVSSSTVVATIGSLTNLKITIHVAEKYSAYLTRGLHAEVSFAAAPGERFSASVSAVRPVVNAANRTIEAELLLDTLDRRVKPGMFADVDLVIRERTNTFVLPKAAVKNYNDKPVVYVIDADSVARRTSVTTGLSNDSEIEIVSGVSAGDRVITAGAVTDGSPVRVAE